VSPEASPIDALDIHCQNPDFLVLTGSRLYGTARYDGDGNCISDYDMRGWTTAPWEYQLEIPGFPFVEKEISVPPEGDHKIANLKQFITCLLKCDFQSFELLFAPLTHIHSISPLGEELRNLREMFITKKFYWRIAGYSNSEWRKARAVKMEIQEPPRELDDIKAWIRNTIKPDKANMDQLDIWLTEHMPRTEVSSLHGINGKRRDEYAKFGYCTSSACHSVRLMNECIELLTTGNLTFPRPEAKLLTDIKHGKMSIAEITPIYEEASAKCDEAFKTSTLPDNADNTAAWKWYRQVVAKAILKDARLKEFMEMSGK
jgi:hypothetical protein